MTLFLHLIIDILSAVVAAAGFITFHIALRHPSTAIKIAGSILVVAGVAGWLGNSYYGLKYLRDGYFDTPAIHENGMMPKKRYRSDDEG